MPQTISGLGKLILILCVTYEDDWYEGYLIPKGMVLVYKIHCSPSNSLVQEL